MNHIKLLSMALALAATLIVPAHGAKNKDKEFHGKKAAPSVAKVQKHASKGKVSAQRNYTTQQDISQSRAIQQRTGLSARSDDRRDDRSYDVTRRYDGRHYESETRHRSYHSYRPPVSIYSGWDRNRVHYWEDRPYRWHGGSWVFYSDYQPYASTRVAYSGSSSSSLVDDVQAALSSRGYRPGPVDGVMGSQTRNAIASYQADHGLAVTGRIDTALLRSLRL